MKFIYSILLVVMVLSSNKIYSQVAPKLLFAGENYAWQNQFAIDKGLTRVYMIYQYAFVAADGLTFDKKKMETNFDRLIPVKDVYGYGVLDWEGYIYDVVVRGSTISAELHRKYLNQFIAAIHYAKKLRPNIKWSYYGIPHRLYSQYSEEKSDSYLKWIIPLMKEMDFLAPSIYFEYDGTTLSQQLVSQYIDASVKYSLDFGDKLKKPVIPFVWHRYHPASKTNGNKLIDYVTFKEMIRKFITTEHFNTKIDGIIWWNSEESNCNSRTTDPILAAEYAGVTDLAAYKYNLLQSYLDSIKSLFNQ